MSTSSSKYSDHSNTEQNISASLDRFIQNKYFLFHIKRLYTCVRFLNDKKQDGDHSKTGPNSFAASLYHFIQIKYFLSCIKWSRLVIRCPVLA
jgi:hypothetical protein